MSRRTMLTLLAAVGVLAAPAALAAPAKLAGPPPAIQPKLAAYSGEIRRTPYGVRTSRPTTTPASASAWASRPPRTRSASSSTAS